jgi:hypothetical protein
MKNQKLLISAAIVCLLVGASGAAMAQETCTEGILQGTEEEPLVVEGDIIITGRSCFINNVIVNGDVTATNSEDLTMIDNEVVGNVRVIGGRFATIIGNKVGMVEDSSNTFPILTVSNNERASVLINLVTNAIVVTGNDIADIKKNVVPFLFCDNNRRLDSFRNETFEEDCRR